VNCVVLNAYAVMRESVGVSLSQNGVTSFTDGPVCII